MAQLNTFQKYKAIIEEFALRQDKTLTGYDEVLKERLNLQPKQIDRLLNELSVEFDGIVLLEGIKRKTYKLLKPIDLFTEVFEHFEDIGWFFSMAHDADPEIFKSLAQYTNQHKNIYSFKNTPFEDINNFESKDIFKRLKTGVELHEYRKIKFMHDEKEYDNLKCLKLIFMDNNWYVAFVDHDEKLRFGRVSFIESVNYATKTGFQPSSVEKQMKFLESVQNSMTLFSEPKKIAKIKATKNIARYFDDGMKIFLSSQKFLQRDEDGSVIFTLEYTQELEILPFIQKWLPDLIILEPQELKDAYLKKLSLTINNHN